jgi:hypothetical protein
MAPQRAARKPIELLPGETADEKERAKQMTEIETDSKKILAGTRHVPMVGNAPNSSARGMIVHA